MTTATEMIEMLRAHYIAPSKPAGGYFAPELAAPEGNRRADLIWLPLTSYQRGEIVGHEVKVSRADVVQELSDPTKADAWLRHCTQWWLVVSDPALIEGLEIPEQWGVMSPPSGRRRRTMTVLKDAPKLKPADQAAALAAIMARMFYSGDDAQAKIKFLTNQVEYAQQQQRTAESRQRDVEAQLRTVQAMPYEAQRIKEVLDAIAQLTRKPGKAHYLAVTPEVVAAAAVDLELVRRRTMALASRIRDRVRRFELALDKVDVRDILEGLMSIERAVQADLDTPFLVDLPDAEEVA